MMYVAVICEEGTAMHVARCLVHNHNLAHGGGNILEDGPTFDGKAASTREVTATEVARADEEDTARGAFAEGFEFEAKIVDRGAAHANNGSVEQQSWEQKNT